MGFMVQKNSMDEILQALQCCIAVLQSITRSSCTRFRSLINPYTHLHDLAYASQPGTVRKSRRWTRFIGPYNLEHGHGS